MWSAIIDLMTFKACYFKYILFVDSGLQLKEEMLLGNATKQFVMLNTFLWDLSLIMGSANFGC